MLFFFKEKPVEIIGFVSEEMSFVSTFAPVVPARKRFPEWWKEVPSSSFNWEEFNAKNTVKSCVGIINSLTSGFIIPMWTDLAIQYNEKDFRTSAADGKTSVRAHTPNASPGFYSEFFHFTIQSPWFFKTPVNLQYLDPVYHFTTPQPYRTMPGIVSYAGGYAGSNIFIFCEKKPSAKIMIQHGTPMLHVVPQTEKKVKFRTEIASHSEMTKMFNTLAGGTHFCGRGLKQNHFLNKLKN